MATINNYGGHERPIPTYSSLAEAEAAMQVMQSELYILGTSGIEQDFSVVFSGGTSLLFPLGHPDSSRILECLEDMLLFNIRHCRSFIIQHTPAC